MPRCLHMRCIVSKERLAGSINILRMSKNIVRLKLGQRTRLAGRRVWRKDNKKKERIDHQVHNPSHADVCHAKIIFLPFPFCEAEVVRIIFVRCRCFYRTPHQERVSSVSNIALVPRYLYLLVQRRAATRTLVERQKSYLVVHNMSWNRFNLSTDYHLFINIHHC
jgi:hypothetical protein